MKNYKLELNEQEKRLIEALLCNEEYYYEEKACCDGDYEMLELIKGILKQLEVK